MAAMLGALNSTFIPTFVPLGRLTGEGLLRPAAAQAYGGAADSYL